MKNGNTKLASLLPDEVKPKQKEKKESSSEKSTIQKNREKYLSEVVKRHISLPGELLSAMTAAKTKCAARRLLKEHFRQLQGF